MSGFNGVPPLPDEIVDQLIQIGSDQDKTQWEMGDFLVAVTDEILPFYSAYLGSDRKAHAWLVRHLAERTGLAVATLRDRESVARFFPDREQIEILTFHQARALKSGGDDWLQYLEWIYSQMDAHGGRVPSVEAIRDRIKGDQSVPKWVRRYDRIIQSLEVMSGDGEAPQVIRDTANQCFIELESAKSQAD